MWLVAAILLICTQCAPVSLAANYPCRCKEQHYCQPVQTAPPTTEIFPFAIPKLGQSDANNTKDMATFWPWDQITTVGWIDGGNETICHAHKMGARVTGGALDTSV